MDPKLVASIRHELRGERKADFLDVIHRYSDKLTKIPLPSNDAVDTAQAFRDAVREDVVLNGIRFVGEHRMEAYVAAIKRIVAKSTPDHARCLEISDRILKSCSRTSSGADSYFALDTLFGSKGILLKPRQEEAPPLDVKVGLDHDKLKCRISTINLFGLYRHEDIDTFMYTKQRDTMGPWVEIDTVIIEYIDFQAGTSTRHLTIRTPQPAPRVTTELKELF